MRRFLKFTLLWLIVFALPVQAAAATTMALCSALHQRMAGVEQAAASLQPHAHTGDVQHDHGPAKAQQELPSEKYSCSACATCCSGAAAYFSEYRGPDSVLVSARPVATGTSRFVGFVPDLPEDPPRHILV